MNYDIISFMKNRRLNQLTDHSTHHDQWVNNVNNIFISTTWLYLVLDTYEPRHRSCHHAAYFYILIIILISTCLLIQ